MAHQAAPLDTGRQRQWQWQWHGQPHPAAAHRRVALQRLCLAVAMAGAAVVSVMGLL